MINKKNIKKYLFTSLMLILSLFFSACGKKEMENIKEGETFEETTTLSYEESVAESIEKESLRRESSKAHKESVKESKRIIEESVVESVKEHQKEVEEILKDDKDYNETLQERIDSIKSKYNKAAIDEQAKSQNNNIQKEEE